MNDGARRLERAVRSAATPRAWSRGVELARADAVQGESATEDEAVLRVVSGGRGAVPTVVLYPADEEWDCDCPSRLDPCEHVCASAIALKLAHEAGNDLPTSERAGGHVGYRFSPVAGGLALSRVIVGHDGGEKPLQGELKSMIAHAGQHEVVATDADLRIDGFLGPPRKGPVPADKIATLLELCATSNDVRLDGEPVQTSGEEILPRAVVEDVENTVVLTIDRDPAVSDVVCAFVARAGNTLRPIGELALSGTRLDKLPLVRELAAAELGTLTTEILPDLSRRIPVDVRSRRIPKTTRNLEPRIDFDIATEHGAVWVFPTLVYGDPPVARIDGGRMVHLGGAVPVRDEIAERTLVSRLRDELNLLPGRKVALEGSAAAKFLASVGRFTGAPDISARPLSPRVVTGGDDHAVTFDVIFEVGGTGDGERTVAADAVITAWRRGLSVIPLGQEFVELPAGWLDRHGDEVAALLAARDDHNAILPHASFALGDLLADLDEPRPAALARLAPLAQSFDGLPSAELPAGFSATLRDYQHRGKDWLAFLRDAKLGGILADDMGLGKTVQTLAALSGRALIVCPRSLVHNWQTEAARFLPQAKVSLYHGPGRAIDPDADITLTTYGVLRQDQELLGARAWDAVVLDEAQAIKNPESQAAQAAFSITAPFRVALTGTPVENRLDELWSLCRFACPGVLGGRKDFADRFEAPIAAGDANAAALLRRRIRPFVLRREKREVAPELPPRTEAILYCELSDKERDLYDAVRAATRKDVVEALGHGKSTFAALEALLRLRQAACHPGLLPGQEAPSSSKVDALLFALTTAADDGHKSLVFSQWTSLLDLLEPHLGEAGIAFTRLDGKTRDRKAVVDEFQRADGPPVLIASLKAGGTGLNLTEADHVFLLDPWWNPAAENQAADRAHRIGQTRPVMIYRVVATATVEERILDLADRKRALADAALGEGGAAAALTRDDLLALLE